MNGNLEYMPEAARSLAEQMSVDAGSLASAQFSALNAARTASLKPFVRFDGVVVPANLEGATSDIHVAILDVARSRRSSNESARLMEQVCARVLSQCPGLNTKVGEVYLHSNTTDETAEVDVFAAGRQQRHFLDAEVKAHYEDRNIPTTPKLYKAGFRGSLSQLAERRRLFLGGAHVTGRGERVALSPDASFVGLGVTLHDYAGLIWRPEVLGEQRGANLMTIADLAVVTSTMRDDAELFEYLEYRELLFARGSGFAHDEIDILSHFLEVDSSALCRQMREMPERTAYMVPARDLPSSLATNMQPPPREEFRLSLLMLPRV
ncbi:hypothetical protein [Microbacterium sp. NPDC090003]|uniref:hypothetical protein n=1 Tax=Microbacterium sp. NPDC090003 TaxID=3364203 RepID=UPI003800AABB